MIALVLDSRAAETQGAANEASFRRSEVAFFHSSLNDVFAKVLEAGSRVLRLRLLDVAMTALDTRRYQHCTSKVCTWKCDYSAGSLTLPVWLSW